LGFWVLGFGPKPPIPNPQSPIPNPQSPKKLEFLIKNNLIIKYFINNLISKIKNKIKK
jgi:hypothetical protein